MTFSEIPIFGHASILEQLQGLNLLALSAIKSTPCRALEIIKDNFESSKVTTILKMTQTFGLGV